ncbi:MAG: glycosyltransferase [Candidatus Lokiarchaeota archaeon]|nr:glycosyltransferase [Candidatus Lokiarchaeota archaeon]
MKITKIIIYGTPLVVFFVLLHLFFPPWLNSKVVEGLQLLFSDFFSNWLLIFPFIGLLVILGFIVYYGIHFLASFGGGYFPKDLKNPPISILIPAKNEKSLLEKTLNSIVNSTYPLNKIQLIVILSGSTDDSIEFCERFAEKYDKLKMIILSEPLDIKGKPAALNYGLKYVETDICVFYDAGCILQEKTLKYLVSPLKDGNGEVAAIGPATVANWNKNSITKGINVDYAMFSGGGLLFEVKNKLGSSAYLFGKNCAILKEELDKFNGFDEDSLTEDLYLTVLLILDQRKIKFSPKARISEIVPYSWDILFKQRTRWLAGFVGDMQKLMEKKKEKRNGASIIISRNMTMMLVGNMDDWVFIVIGFVIFYAIAGFYYLLFWGISCLVFIFGYILNAIRKYGNKHYSTLLWFPISAFIHIYMFLRQFWLPDELSWEKTPLILKKDDEEIKELTKALK